MLQSWSRSHDIPDTGNHRLKSQTYQCKPAGICDPLSHPIVCQSDRQLAAKGSGVLPSASCHPLVLNVAPTSCS